MRGSSRSGESLYGHAVDGWDQLSPFHRLTDSYTVIEMPLAGICASNGTKQTVSSQASPLQGDADTWKDLRRTAYAIRIPSPRVKAIGPPVFHICLTISLTPPWIFPPEVCHRAWTTSIGVVTQAAITHAVTEQRV